MKTITLMIVSALFGEDQATFAVIPFPSRDACEVAAPAIFSAVAPSFPDLSVACQDTGILTESPYPKPRPETF